MRDTVQTSFKSLVERVKLVMQVIAIQTVPVVKYVSRDFTVVVVCVTYDRQFKYFQHQFYR